ncbi:MAG: TolC family protein [Pseudomonadales bacterium]|jgi:outer membrane protein, heavy metal efflux system|nr:TolC family protein [Pseudomonadales bacterium]
MAIAINPYAAWLTVLFALYAYSPVSGAKIESNLSVSEAVIIAVRDNPSLAQLRARYDALQQIPSQVGTLPDPMIGLSAMNFPATNFHRRQEPMTQVQLSFLQSIPFPGKLRLEREAAEFDAQAAGLRVEELRLQIMANVRAIWWQAFYLDRALETVRSNRKLFREFIQIARKKYETGTGLQQDVLLAQLELSKLIEQEISLESMRDHQGITLNILMGLPKQGELGLVSAMKRNLEELESRDYYFLRAETRPLLMQKMVQLEAANKRLNVAEKDRLPDFLLGVNYGDRQGDNPNGSSRDDLLSVMLGIKVPIYASRKQDKAIVQRTAEVQGAVYASQDVRGQVRGAISRSLTDYSSARKQFELFESSILPQSNQTVQSMLSGYRVSQVDFLNLVRAQSTLLNYELQYWRAFVDAKQSLARLEAAVGGVNIYE